MPQGMSPEESKQYLMKKAEELKTMAMEYDIPLSELFGEGELEGESMMEEEMESSPDIEKAVMMMKAMEAK